MNHGEMKSIWGYGEESIEDFYSTKFLSLLVQYGYVWTPDEQKALNINLGQDEKELFLRDFSEFVEDFDELKASEMINNIKEIYNEEYHKLLRASKNKNESRFPWFPLAHKLFREAMIKESDGENLIQQHTGFASVENFPPMNIYSATSDDPLSPKSADLTEEDPLSPPSEIFTDEDSSTRGESFADGNLALVRSDDAVDENSSPQRAEIFADEISLFQKAEVFTNEYRLMPRYEASTDENPMLLIAKTSSIGKSLPLRIKTSANECSLSSSLEALVDDDSSRDEAFIDGDLLPSFDETSADDNSSPAKNTTFKDFIFQEGRTCGAIASLSPATKPFTTVSQTTIFSSSITSISPAARSSLSPTTGSSLSLGLKETFSNSRGSTSPSKQPGCIVIGESENMNAFKIAKERNQVTRTSLSPVTRTSLSPVTRTSLSPVTRTSLSPVTRTSPTERTNLSPAFKRTLSNPHKDITPLKQQKWNLIAESGNTNTSETIEKRNRMSRSRSLTHPKRRLQPLIHFIKPISYGNEIKCYPTSSDVETILHKRHYSNSRSSVTVENVPNHEGDVKTHSNVSRSSHEIKTLFRKERPASRSSSFCPYSSGHSNMPSCYEIKTETTDNRDLKNSEIRRFAQSAASFITENAKRPSEFSVPVTSRGKYQNRIFVKKAANLLNILPPRLALECETFIFHFLHETLKCSNENELE